VLEIYSACLVYRQTTFDGILNKLISKTTVWKVLKLEIYCINGMRLLTNFLIICAEDLILESRRVDLLCDLQWRRQRRILL
jgi:hypothetical protein